jgi:hypothetical protein
VDPTAEGVMPMETMEAVPLPQGQPMIEHAAPNGEARPFVLPPEQRQEGKPFILPPGEQTEGKPFIDRQDQSRRSDRGAGVELQPSVGWQAPHIDDPFPVPPTPAALENQLMAAAPPSAAEQPPAPLTNVQRAPNQNPYPPAPAAQRPNTQFPYVK